ncbi:MAG: lysine--tRNA ligase [Candidatus Zambryskibacteria bacterium RIFCSPLOWO2_01_FULL_39_39]|uniref:Lysine--tRNA ligase n=1 Tax=Candidatus Zambryskibacteria bacterium RIFCSPLOWO2_01_FULL_39_39 TaxID=1802758 RepID=A0A1G2TVT8_9BACT|nr:MAG: Lysine-tRNA ligase [Parcubacteria group bacterium GW2011_GWA1_38_7]OHA86586.1 MAG: lysine--tRNA ligase [Candidatus Zambryskibacteria bacterium RIFCSPHIGHO2_01_FULL_39_63]OHA94245.1 MAG: lysine--tRNA ligase [Candidatus Zambryskibacteria bacterium RIFCSPHIGHO2_02_FULL_39_19]OHA98488.1 MAG: lysine--tRNA ligase [Candidatus Zambryskibacteria bacterium RIFCSPHIGHO2_12_FULL_39_21]OHB01407.1 MAG: lysine--tRNA ligase [Candidatus Zambryskibacteria bacterium RIFCSPLOWO2_01_FULL_39_39]
MRLDIEKESKPGEHWSETVAQQVKKIFPNSPTYTTAAGISPSGVVHFGNFRDVITSYAVYLQLKSQGLNAKFIFSWDNFDRLRKVPAGVPENFSQYIGMPLSAIPSPKEGYSSYAEYFQKPFEEAMKELSIDLEYRYQTDEYKSGRYDEFIFLALKKRKEIAKILLSLMTEKGKQEGGIVEAEYIENYYPISVYSHFTGKDSTKVLSFDGKSSITYHCIESNKTETIDLSRDRIVKLAWKVDWPMRWGVENIVFEPGGHDHASPGGSFDVSSVIAKEIFGIKEPIFAEYKFVGIQGGGVKMSGSKGNAISPTELLEIYEPTLLKWLYMRKNPSQAFSLAFDTEIYRQYDEFDKGVSLPEESMALKLSKNPKYNNPIPFKQAVALGQITQWNEEKIKHLISDLGVNYDEKSIQVRLPRAKNWLEKYNPEEVIKLLDVINVSYIVTLDEKTKEQIKKLKKELTKEYSSIKELELLVYSIPKDPTKTDKENAPAQKEFFKHIYNLLIGRDAGPRLSTFLWAVDREKVLKLLNI